MLEQGNLLRHRQLFAAGVGPQAEAATLIGAPLALSAVGARMFFPGVGHTSFYAEWADRNKFGTVGQAGTLPFQIAGLKQFGDQQQDDGDGDARYR